MMQPPHRLAWISLHRPSIRQVLPLFVRAVAVAFAVAFGVLAVVEALRQHYEGDAQQRAAQERLFGLANQLRQELAADVGELAVAARTLQLLGHEAAPATSGERLDPPLAGQLTDHYRLTLEERPHVYQLRVLSDAGYEVLRVERTPAGVRVVPRSELQDKRTRDYFESTHALPEGELFLSALDLNREHGRVEWPRRPTMRLATPVRARGQRLIVVANFDARRILNIVESRALGERGMLLLNGSGYYLSGVDDARSFAFMTGRDDSLRRDMPSLWDEVRSGSPGTDVIDGQLYAYQTLDPAAEDLGGIRHGDRIHGTSRFHLVSHEPALATFRWSLMGTTSAIVFLVGVVAFAWLFAWGAAGRELAQAQRAVAESKLFRNERMASLGALVAGVAHELNTPIGNAVTIASAIVERVGEIDGQINGGKLSKSSILGFVDHTRSGAGFLLRNLERAAELVRKFKDVAVDRANEQRRRFALDDYLDEIRAMLAPQFRHGSIALRLQARSGAELDSFPGALSQVVVNLVNNSRLHAFGDGQAGTVTISSRALHDGQVELVVEDDGAGMPEHVRERIFEPFFTTRLGQGGSGLGLSIVQNIVHQVLGGEIQVESEQGRFTRFVVKLPRRAPETAGKQEPHHVTRATA